MGKHKRTGDENQAPSDDGGFWIQVPLRVARDKQLTPSGKLVYGVILSLSKGSKGRCVAGNEAIAERAGISLKQLLRSLRALVGARLIGRSLNGKQRQGIDVLPIPAEFPRAGRKGRKAKPKSEAAPRAPVPGAKPDAPSNGVLGAGAAEPENGDGRLGQIDPSKPTPPMPQIDLSRLGQIDLSRLGQIDPQRRLSEKTFEKRGEEVSCKAPACARVREADLRDEITPRTEAPAVTLGCPEAVADLPTDDARPSVPSSEPEELTPDFLSDFAQEEDATMEPSEVDALTARFEAAWPGRSAIVGDLLARYEPEAVGLAISEAIRLRKGCHFPGGLLNEWRQRGGMPRQTIPLERRAV